MTDVRMPELGETISQGTITQWFKEVGSPVTSGEALFEVSTEKVDAEVPSPISGTITKILIASGATVDVGAVVAEIDEAGQASVSAPAVNEVQPGVAAAAPASAPVVEATPAPAPETPPNVEPAAPVAAPPSSVALVSTQSPKLVTSPIVRRLMNDLGPDANLVTGTGPEGRVTRQDAEKVAFSSEHRREASRPAATATAPTANRLAPAPAPSGADFVPSIKRAKSRVSEWLFPRPPRRT